MAKRCWLRSEHLIRVTRPSQCLGAVRATRTNGSLRPTATGSSISMIALPARVRASASHSETHQAEHSRPRPTRHMVPSKNLHAIAPSTHCQSASSVEASSQPESHRRVAESARRHGSEKPEHPRNIDQTDTLNPEGVASEARRPDRGENGTHKVRYIHRLYLYSNARAGV